MKKTSLLLSLLLMIAVAWSAAPGQAQEGVLLRVELAPGANYCHLKFPAIREDTLFSTRPVLKDPRTSDIIDFYGPCNHDPLGREEIIAQRLQRQREIRQEGDDD
ncbi:MAG: hypothetical protein HY695_19480 [Deltaproteobacteria bacterium]|nr:hypothetical protein [Deltaproteobacteria bacterium]